VSAFFVTGAGTEIGKTYVSCALLRAWSESGVACDAFKPVVSGFDRADAAQSDSGLLLGALGEAVSDENIARISPWRFAAPLAPPLAAKAEGAALDFAAIERACRARIEVRGDRVLLIEGAGGVMAPLTDDRTGLDLIAALNMPAVFVAGSYLGAVSHALTGLAVLDARTIKVAAVVVSESAVSAGLDATCAMIARMWPGHVIAAPRGAPISWCAPLAHRLAAQQSI
jgi:dethiobiotin synthetase